MMKRVLCILLCLIMVGLCLPLASGDSTLTVLYAMPDGRKTSNDLRVIYYLPYISYFQSFVIIVK